MFASGHQVAVAFAQPDLGVPADGLNHLGVFFAAQLPMAADRGGSAGGPGAFPERPSGLGIASFGDRALVAALPGGIFRRDQPQELHQCTWGVKPGQVAKFGDHGDSHGALHATESLQGVDHRMQTPGLHVLVEFLVETLAALGVFRDRPDIFVEHALLRRGRADDL